MTAALMETWLLLFLLAAGLVAGSIALLAAARLLGESWLEELGPALARGARAAPWLLLLALPSLVWPERLYPWAVAGVPGDAARAAWYAPGPFALRGVLALLLWSAAAWLAARPGPAWRSGLALLLLALSAPVALEDWALSRDLGWMGSLQGLALLLQASGAALALAMLTGPLARLEAEDESRTGVERALLTLAVGTLWLWFVQFVVVWSADIPDEAAWYLRRAEGGWWWLKFGVVLPALLGAVALAAAPQWAPWRMRAVCGLMVVQHLAHLAWVVRPDAALSPAAPGGAALWLADLAGAALLLGAAALLWRRRRTA